jgi:hypothetical protein
MPAQAVSGRVFQAEAFYVRDLAAPYRTDIAARTSTEKIAKLAAIFSVWEQPDGAAELLVKFRDRLSALFDVDRALDLLAAQTQRADGKDEVDILSYRDYLALFATDPPDFYPAPPPPPPPKPTLRQRLDAAYEAWSDWHYAEKVVENRRRWAALEKKRKAGAAPDDKT